MVFDITPQPVNSLPIFSGRQVESYMNSIYEINPELDKMVQKAFITFSAKLKAAHAHQGELLSEAACKYHNQAKELLKTLPLENLVISLRPTDSIFYRFKLRDTPQDFSMEVFYDFDPTTEEEDILATLHIHNQKKKEAAHYGSIQYLIGIVSKYVSNPIRRTHAIMDENKTFLIPIGGHSQNTYIQEVTENEQLSLEVSA